MPASIIWMGWFDKGKPPPRFAGGGVYFVKPPSDLPWGWGSESDKSKVHVAFPSSVSLTKKGEYTHIPFRVKNRGIQMNGNSVNPASVKVGSDGHSLEIAFSGLVLNTTETSVTSASDHGLFYCGDAFSFAAFRA